MSQPPYLTDDEIEFITRPLKQGAARLRYFRSLGVHPESRPNGQPLVWRGEYEMQKAGKAKVEGIAANDEPGAGAPDFEALRNRVRYGRGTEKKKQSAGA